MSKKKNDFNAWATKQKEPNFGEHLNHGMSQAVQALISSRTGLSSGMLRHYSNNRRNSK